LETVALRCSVLSALAPVVLVDTGWVERLRAGQVPDELVLGPPPVSPQRRHQRRILAPAIVTAVVLIAGASIIASHGPSLDGGSAPSPTPVSGPTKKMWGSAARSASPPRPVVSTFESSLRDLGVDLFARSEDTVFKIEAGTGRVTATSGVRLTTSAPVAFIAGPDRVVLRPWDDVTGFVVPDGQVARPLTGLLAKGTRALPGPPGRLWVADGQWSSKMTLIGFDGRSTGTVVDSGAGNVIGDGRGGLLLTDIGGTYHVTPQHTRRVTRGTVIAVGEGHLLVADCNGRHVCSRYLYDRSTKEQRRIGGVRTEPLPSGTISPNGHYAALTTWPRVGDEPLLTVVELASGRALIRRSGTNINGDPYPERSNIWLPDNRLAGLHRGRLFLFDPRARRSSQPELKLPTLLQLAARAPH